MGWPSWTELVGIVTPIGLGYGWWVRRRDRSSKLVTDNITLKAENDQLKIEINTITIEAEKTRRTQSDTIDDLKSEIAEWRRQVERREDRIESLEDRLYTRGGA